MHNKLTANKVTTEITIFVENSSDLSVSLVHWKKEIICFERPNGWFIQ